MQYIDYYQTLGVARSASEKEIKQAYRQLARQHHPDLHQGDAKPAAEEKFKLINEAYEVLSDPEKRAKYDQLGANWQADSEFAANPAANQHYTYRTTADFGDSSFAFSDFFASIFGQNFANDKYQDNWQQKATAYKGENVHAVINLTITELLGGTEKELSLSTPRVCPTCQGQRFTPQGICPDCSGTGSKEEARTVKVKIPAGMYPGATLRLKQLGGQGYGDGPAGDLYLQVQVTSDTAWQITGSDLETELTLSPEQAVLGDSLKIPTPHGAVQLTIQPGTHSGQRLRLRNKGLPQKQGMGDLYLKIRIDIPQTLSPAAKELYAQLRKLNTQAMPEAKIA